MNIKSAWNWIKPHDKEDRFCWIAAAVIGFLIGMFPLINRLVFLLRHPLT